jgi:hypothetical protein
MLVLPDGVAFTGEFKLVSKATGYEKGRRPTGTGVRRLREPTFPVLFDRISDPQIPLTRQKSAVGDLSLQQHNDIAADVEQHLRQRRGIPRELCRFF